MPHEACHVANNIMLRGLALGQPISRPWGIYHGAPMGHAVEKAMRYLVLYRGRKYDTSAT